jgi:arsenate reductase-like glutaredoxin family protein
MPHFDKEITEKIFKESTERFKRFISIQTETDPNLEIKEQLNRIEAKLDDILFKGPRVIWSRPIVYAPYIPNEDILKRWVEQLEKKKKK